MQRGWIYVQGLFKDIQGSYDVFIGDMTRWYVTDVQRSWIYV